MEFLGRKIEDMNQKMENFMKEMNGMRSDVQSFQKMLQQEEERRYKAEAHPYTIIKVARDEDFRNQIGKDIYFDLVDFDKVRSFHILKQTPFVHFKEEVAKEFGIPVQFQRFWLWLKRENHTYRPHRLLTPQEEAQSIGPLREVVAKNKAHSVELKLFLEVELGLDLHPIASPHKTEEDILLFFKFYDPEKRELRYIGRLFVKSYGTPMEILSKINQMAGLSPDEQIELYEEIKFEPFVVCQHLNKTISFRQSEIQDGDIICFQKSQDIPSFYKLVHSRQEK